VFNQAIVKHIFVGAVLGFFYYILQLVIRPAPYTDVTHEAGKFFASIAVGVAIYMLLFFLKSKKRT
jgi:hypothetical protein